MERYNASTTKCIIFAIKLKQYYSIISTKVYFNNQITFKQQMAIDQIHIENINKLLDELEETNKIKVIYAVESGSRAWGFSSDDSDYDIRFIYYYTNPTSYVSIDPVLDTITGFSLDRIYDWHGWDIVKTLKHLKESNPSIIEWLFSPVIYRTDEVFKKSCLEIIRQMHTRSSLMYHYKSMAYTNWMTHIANQEDVNCKKYFYVIRPISMLHHLLEQTDDDTLSLEINLDNVLLILEPKLKKETYAEIQKLITLKRTLSELGQTSRIKLIDEWVLEQFDRFQKDNENDNSACFTAQSTISLFNKLKNEYRKVKALCARDDKINRTEYLNMIGTMLQFIWLLQHPDKTYKQVPQKINHILQETILPEEIYKEITTITHIDRNDEKQQSNIQTQAGKDLLNIWLTEPIKQTCLLLGYSIDNDDILKETLQKINNGVLPRDDLFEIVVKQSVLPLFNLLKNPDDRFKTDPSISILPGLSEIVHDNKIKRYNDTNHVLNQFVQKIIDENVTVIDEKHKQLIHIRDELTKQRYNNSIKGIPSKIFTDMLLKYIKF